MFFFFFTLILTLCSLPIIPVEYRRIWFLCTVFVFSWRQCTPIHSRYRSDTRYESYDRARERKKVDNHRFVVVCFFLSSLPSKKDRFLWLNSVVSVEECVRLMYRNDVDMVAHDKESERASKGSDLPKRGNTYHRVPLHRMYKIIDILCVRRNDREWFRLLRCYGVHMYEFGCCKQMKSLPWKHIDRFTHNLFDWLYRCRVQLSFGLYIFRSIDTFQMG